MITSKVSTLTLAYPERLTVFDGYLEGVHCQVRPLNTKKVDSSVQA